jgi:hypothetical protein
MGLSTGSAFRKLEKYYKHSKKGSNGKDLKMDNLWITQVSYSMNDDSKTIKIKCTDGARKEAMTEEFK